MLARLALLTLTFLVTSCMHLPEWFPCGEHAQEEKVVPQVNVG